MLPQMYDCAVMVLFLTDKVQLITLGVVSESEGQFGLAKLFNVPLTNHVSSHQLLTDLGKTKGGLYVLL